MIILPISVASWFFGLFAVYHANLAMFSLVSALNMALGISIFVFHSLGNPKVKPKLIDGITIISNFHFIDINIKVFVLINIKIIISVQGGSKVSIQN